MDNNKAIELCELGIAEKRKGNFEQALFLYNEAKLYNPKFLPIYKNSAKVLIGIGQFDKAFRHLMTVSHLNLFVQKYDTKDFNYLENYNWKENISSKSDKKYLSNLLNIVTQDPILNRIVIDVNITNLAGICYIMCHNEISEHNSIDPKLSVVCNYALL